MIIRTLRRAVVLVVPVLLVAAGCATVTPDAATISYDDSDGKHTERIRRSDFTDELQRLLASEQIRAAFEIADDTALPVDATADWLRVLISQIPVDAEFDARGLEVSDAARAQAEGVVRGQWTAEIFAEFDGDLRQTLIVREARLRALNHDAADRIPYVPPDAAEIQAYADEFGETLDDCLSGRSVADILVADEERAGALLAELEAGAVFEELAARNSIDFSAENGGHLGCLDSGQFPPEFVDAALRVDPGEFAGPVQTDFGFHVIAVLDPAEGGARERRAVNIAAQRAGPLEAALAQRLDALRVDVDPRYGTWERDDATARWIVVAPTPPEVRSQREPDGVIFVDDAEFLGG